MKYNTVIFDLDGTLLNTLEDLAASVNYALTVHNMPKRSIDEVRRFIGNGVAMLIRRSVQEGTSEDEISATLSDFKEHYKKNIYNKTVPYVGITELLAELKKRGYKLAIVSNKVDFAVKDLRDKFFPNIDVAIGDSPDMERKPAPDMVFRALEELGSTADESVYIGDTSVDIMTAKNSGMDSISTSWGFRERKELTDYGAMVIVDTPMEILNYV